MAHREEVREMRDIMNMLTDDELGLILNRVRDSKDRKSASLVCKKWMTVEGLTRTFITVLEIDRLPRLLVRFPNLVAFRTFKPITSSDQFKLVAKACPKLETLVLDCYSDEFDNSEVGDEGLRCIANGCSKLSKIVFGGRGIGLVGFKSLITSPAGLNLSHLEVSRSCKVSNQMLEAIGSSKSPIRFLILDGLNITDAGLAFLADGSCSKTIKHLAISWCIKITDVGVVPFLGKMRVLEELCLNCCSYITDVGGVAISTVSTLTRLKLERISLTDRTVVALAENCLNLEVLILYGKNLVLTGAGVRSFCGHKHLEFLRVASCFREISGCDFESLALGCPSLKAICVEKGLRERLLHEMQESTVSRPMHFI